jgi:hypothetical protein
LIYRKEFIYFPRFLVQTGKPPLFKSKENAKAFLRMHRQGRLQGHYADIINQAVTPTVDGQRVIQSFLTHGQNDEAIRITKREFPMHDFEDDRVLTCTHLKGVIPFLMTRLSRKVISESEIVAKLSEQELLLNKRSGSKRLTVKNLSRGKSELTDELLTEFINLWTLNSKLLRIRQEERYYDRKAVEEKLGLIHPLRVSGLLKPLPLEERAEITRSEHDREVNKLYEWVMSNPQRLDDVPRALIRDDLAILSDDNLTRPRLLIVTDDWKLVNACATLRSFNWRQPRETFHTTMENWVLADLTTSGTFEPDEVLVDEGSLDGYLDKLDAEGKEPPDPDGQPFVNRYRLIRPTGKLKIPLEVMEMHRLRGELPSIDEAA